VCGRRTNADDFLSQNYAMFNRIKHLHISKANNTPVMGDHNSRLRAIPSATSTIKRQNTRDELYIGRVAHDCTSHDICHYMANTINIQTKESDIRKLSNSSYCVSVPHSYMKTALMQSKWPSNITIRRFEKNTKNHIDLSNSSHKRPLPFRANRRAGREQYHQSQNSRYNQYRSYDNGYWDDHDDQGHSSTYKRRNVWSRPQSHDHQYSGWY
jgi:hypothetical protein